MKPSSLGSPTSRHGFTIVELLIVIIVIAILAAISVAAYTGMQARARDSQRDTAISQIAKGLELYRIANGGYPTPCTNVNADCPVADLAGYLVPDYLDSMPEPLRRGNYRHMFFNNGNTTTYTMLIFFESKPICKRGVNPSTSYYSTYPMC